MPDLLTQLNIKLSYRTGQNDLVRDFFVPCLERAAVYRRAAGYFTSSGLALAARGIASLAIRQGKMKLVVSPYLEPQDIDALIAARDDTMAAIHSIAARSLADIEDALLKDQLNALAWLSATGLLEVKIALPVDSSGRFKRGLFHEKIGIFSDEENNHVAFSGSSNETAGGLLENFESIKAFCSWSDREGRVDEEIQNFEDLWSDSTRGLKVLEFTEVSREILERFRDPSKPPPGLISSGLVPKDKIGKFAPPSWIDLRPYQSDAIRAWAKAGGKGILAMATGTGKTLTALTLASKVAEKNRPMVVIIVCPFINLCKQWVQEVSVFGLQAIECFEGRQRWENEFEECYQTILAGGASVNIIVTTNATYMSEVFQTKIKARVDGGLIQHLLIADEVHNLGSGRTKECLLDGFKLRLGLSATPERHADPDGTQAIMDYFGGVVYEYGLAKAIADGRLCQYRYYPVLVDLTEEEAEEYEQITLQLSRYFVKRGDGDDHQDYHSGAMRLLTKRARLLGAASNKLEALSSVLSQMPERPSKALFYCGDGTTSDLISSEEKRQVEAVASLLGNVHELRVRNFTYRESPEEREEIIRNLTSGYLDGVVAIRCLDEGIDIPDLRMGFLLASTTNPRQFIQRRGRLLRPANGKNRAIIYDFIVRPPDFGGTYEDSSFNMERRLFIRELERVVDFCRTAENGPEALHVLSQLRIKYNLISA